MTKFAKSYKLGLTNRSLAYYDIAINLFKEVKEMAYIINDDCIKCGACAGECPVSCIVEGDAKYEINADECIECGNCANVCPVDAPQA